MKTPIPISRFLVSILCVLFCHSSIHVLGKEEPAASQIAEWRKAAEEGNAEAQFDLGSAYNGGNGVDQDATEAAKWFRAAADQGHADAQCELAFLYQCGNGLPENAEEATMWYRKAAEQGNITAQIRLGIRYMGGSGAYAAGVVPNEAEGLKWWERASEQGSPDAALLLGEHYLKSDFDQGIKWLKLAAERNDPYAQTYLGDCYANGKEQFGSPAKAVKWFKDVAKEMTNETPAENNLDISALNFEEASKWYRKAAEQNHGPGLRMLGLCHYYGLGLHKDIEKATGYYLKGAEQNDVAAQILLGYCYSKGTGVDKDRGETLKWWRKATYRENVTFNHFIETWSKEPDKLEGSDEIFLGDFFVDADGVLYDREEAKNWYLKAADRGSAEAQRKLGLNSSWRIRADGISDSAEWFLKAANQGDADSQFHLGNYYSMGYAARKDVKKGVYWYRKAAEQDHAEAQILLACHYRDGDGVIKDAVEAYKWAIISAAHENKDKWKAKGVANQIESTMTREQIAEGQRMARAFKPLKSTNPGEQTAGEPKVTATGFLITHNGYLVTNHHVVKDCVKVRVQTAAGLLDSVVVRVDAASDLALLKVNGTFDALPVVSSRIARLGAMVATVGFPNIGLQGFEPKLSKGEIASLAGIQDDVRYFQISAPIQPGNSGGALVDSRGNIVGVITSQLSQKAALESSGALAQNVNYAVKSSYLLSFLEAVPEVGTEMLKERTNEQKFEAVVDDVKKATVLIIGY